MATSIKGADAIRDLSLRLHEEVRRALHDVAHLAACAQRGDTSCLPDLRRGLHRLALAVRRHATEEARALDPYLSQVDAWGPERVERLARERDMEIRLTNVDADDPDAAALVRAACGLIRPLARLLRKEECEALSPDVLRDDIVAINQEDG